MYEISWRPLVGLAFGTAVGFAGAFGGMGAFVIVLVLGVVGAAQAVGEVNGAHGTARRVLGVATPGGAGLAAPKVAVQVDGQLAPCG